MPTSAASLLTKSDRADTPFWLGAVAFGVLLRIVLVLIAPRYGYMGDHDDFVRWGLQAANEGVVTLYDHPPPRRPVRVWSHQANQWAVGERGMDRLCNYPPISVYLLAVSGHVFKAISPDNVVNTTTSRAIYELWAIACDFLVAWGVASIVALLRDKNTAKWAFLLILALPPLAWDSAVWGQMDSLFLAPAVWMVRALLVGHWGLAGLLLGLAAGLKPQALLLLPIWAMAALLTRQYARAAAALALAVAVTTIAALPFILHGGLAWFRASYAENVGAYVSQTTLNAFNIWYVDVLITGTDDAARRWLGLTKNTWGLALLAGALTLGLIWFSRRWRGRVQGVLLWSAFALLACVILPTQVHERYLLLSLPFFAAAAFKWPRLWTGFVLLTLTCTAQVTWPNWMLTEARDRAALSRDLRKQYEEQLARLPNEERPNVIPYDEYEADMLKRYAAGREKTVPIEWLLVLLALAGAALAAGATLTAKPDSPDPKLSKAQT